MPKKQKNIQRDQGSPSNLLNGEDNSQSSLNASAIHKNDIKTMQKQPTSIQNNKKRLKFDAIFQKDADQLINNIDFQTSQPNQNIDIQVSNCLMNISHFLKSQNFSYIQIFMLILFFINCSLQAVDRNHQVTQISHKIDFGLQIYFTFSLLIKFLHYQKQILFWIILDIITNISGYISFGITSSEPLRYFRAIKTLRLLLIAKQSTYLQVPALKLIRSLSSVGKILIPAAMFIYLYAVVGLYSFRDYEYSKCRDPSNKLLLSNWTVIDTSTVYLCGQKTCPAVSGVQYQCLNPIDFGVQPNKHELDNIYQGFGLMRYNNIFYSLFSTFKQTFITGSSRLMILGKQVTNYFWVLIYYLSFIYLLAYIYLNIFYGLLITNEQQAQDQQRQSSFVLKINRASTRQKTNNLQDKPIEGQSNGQAPKTPQFLNKKDSKDGMKNSNTSKKTNQFINDLGDIKQESQKSEFDQVIQFNQGQLQSLKKSNSSNNKQKMKLRSKFSTFAMENNSQQSQEKKIEPIVTEEQQLENEQKTLKYGQIMNKYYYFNHALVMLCSLNILIDFEKQSYQTKLIVDCIDFAFFWLYLAEMIFRIIIHKKYVPKQPFDKAFKLDLFVFFLCTIGLTYQISTAQDIKHFLMASDNQSKVLRTIKYLRIFILISSTPFFTQAKIIFNSTLQAIYSVRYFSLLWFLVLMIFSIMGYHMFNGKVKINHHHQIDLQNGKPQNIAFQGLQDSFIYTVFIFFNQQWDYFLFQQYIGQTAWIVIWDLIVLVVGLQILSKYFMALLMKELGDKLSQQQTLKIQNCEEVFLQNEQQLTKNQSTIKNNNKITPLQNISPQSSPKSLSSFTLKLKNKQSLNGQIVVKRQASRNHSRISVNHSNGLVRKMSQMNEEFIKIKRQQEQAKHQKLRDIVMGDNNSQISEINQVNKVSQEKNKTLKIVAKNQINTKQTQGETRYQCLNNLKIKFNIILKSKAYIILKILVILVSVVCTLGTNPLKDPSNNTTKSYQQIWYATVCFFALDILIHILAFGLFTQKIGYLRKLMNWLYMLVFVLQILSFIPGFYAAYNLQYLLSFRILRIFIFVELKYEHDSDMRLTMVAFYKLLPKVANLLAITIVMYGFFAIILVKLYKDDFYYCDGYQQHATITTLEDCLNWGGSWVQRRMNVSNIFSSLLYLFLVATTQGWSTQVMEAASLAGGNHQPSYGKSTWMEFFFAIFFFFGNMIMLNVFIGLSVYNFQKIKSQVTGLASLSKQNKMWFSIKNTIYRLSPNMKDVPSANALSQFVHSFKNSATYKIINIIFFLLFVINMSLYTTNMNASNQKTLQIILKVFMGLFIFQYVISWIALGMRVLKHKKTLYETIGIIYFIVIIVLDVATQIDPKSTRILHSIEICFLAIRYFALLYEVQFVRKMINSLVSIFPQTSNVWLLLFLVLLTYGTIGIYLFGSLKPSPQLNEFDQNYVDLPSAIYALIKFSTLQAPIAQIVDSTGQIQPNSVCYNIFSFDDYSKYGRMGCGRQAAGYIFFLSFHLIYSLILLSTMLAIIVDAYAQVKRQQQSMVNKFQLQQVQKQWQNFDPQATGYISYRDFWIFTAKLVKIYKVNGQQLMSHETKQSFLKSLQIPIYQDENGVLSFQFHEVIQALTKIVVKQKLGRQWESKQADKIFKNHNHSTNQSKLMKKSFYDSSHVQTLIIIKSGLKIWKRKAVKTENNQNLQNLFTLAKKQKQRGQANNNILNQYNVDASPENGNSTSNNLKSQKQNKNNMIQQSETVVQNQKTKKDLNIADSIKKQVKIQKQLSIREQEQSIEQVQIKNDKIKSKVAIQQKQVISIQRYNMKKTNKNIDNPKIQSSKQNIKIKSPRNAALQTLYSERTKKTQHPEVIKQEEDISELQEIN